VIEAAIHVTVMAAVAAAFFLARHGFGPVWTTFAIALIAVSAGRLAALGWRMRDKSKRTGNALIEAVVLASIAIAAGAYMTSYGAPKRVVSESEKYMTVDELLAHPDTESTLRVRGTVQPGSIFKKVVDQRMYWKFTLESNGKQLLVELTGLVPDTFRDGSDTVAIGELAGDGVFRAREVMSKCPSRYEGAKPGNTTYH